MVLIENTTIILFLYSKYNLPTEDENFQRFISDMKSKKIYNKYINSLCVDKREILSWLENNEANIVISQFPVFSVTKIINNNRDVKIYQLCEYETIKNIICQVTFV